MSFSLSSFLITLVICLTFSSSISEGSHAKNLPSAVIVGTVYCNTCFHQGFSKFSHFISGASVVVECKDEQSKSTTTFREESKTNEYGEFEVHLPTSISKHVKKIKACSVKLQSSNEPSCAVASSATSTTLHHIKSKNMQGAHIFSAGFLTFNPQQRPNVCNQKPNSRNSKNYYNSMKSFSTTPPGDPAMPSPPIYELPPLPQLPKLPSLPELPPLPKLPPWLAKMEKKNELLDQKTIPATFFFPLPPFFPSPPPLIPLPPNPFQPPPPSLFPPNPFHPSPPPSIFPPIPFLNPPPSPPPPAFFRFHRFHSLLVFLESHLLLLR